MRLPAAKFAVLAVLSFTASITVILSHSPSESDEPDQPLSSQSERHASEAVLLRITAKYQIARDIIAGRLSLKQAAALFGALNQVPPQLVDWPWRFRFPADTDEKRLCRQVLKYVSSELDEEPDRREATMVRLEADLKEKLCEEGANRLRNSLILVPVEKRLAQARVAVEFPTKSGHGKSGYVIMTNSQNGYRVSDKLVTREILSQFLGGKLRGSWI